MSVTNTEFKQILPHGGSLVSCMYDAHEINNMVSSKYKYKLNLNSFQLSDVEMILNGAYSPIAGFMSSEDYYSVVEHMRLSNGKVWSIPITLPVSEDIAKNFEEGDDIALIGLDGSIIASMVVQEKFTYDKKQEAQQVYATTDEEHPGVANVYQQGNILISGKLIGFKLPNEDQFSEYRLTPRQSRELFRKKGWHTVVGFQTRNPIHRAHEYIQKCALQVVDGLFIHPLTGFTKAGDIPAEIRMQCYTKLMDNFYPKDRVALGVNPAAMRYAGPREAIFHALVRKNYGCTHFIVGRDHAGVGKYYGTYDAQNIFDQFTSKELGIVPLKFEHSFWCYECGEMASLKTCPHSDRRLSISGTAVRAMLETGEIPPIEFTRPAIAEVLIKYYKKKQ